MSERDVRYQAVIVREDRILLIRHIEHDGGRSYWIFPGGGIEPGESEEDCVRHEVQEETNLVVRVERLLMDEPNPSKHGYRSRKTYLCFPISGEAQPGYEPEDDAQSVYAIGEVKWFDLRDESGWDSILLDDPITYGQLQQVRNKLGYR